jgi:hypothetical protein
MHAASNTSTRSAPGCSSQTRLVPWSCSTRTRAPVLRDTAVSSSAESSHGSGRSAARAITPGSSRPASSLSTSPAASSLMLSTRSPPAASGSPGVRGSQAMTCSVAPAPDSAVIRRGARR